MPVLFIDTGKLFDETMAYREQLTARLGLTDLRVLHPDPALLGASDPSGTLWFRDADACCAIRKVEPLQRGLKSFDAWINWPQAFPGPEPRHPAGGGGGGWPAEIQSAGRLDGGTAYRLCQPPWPAGTSAGGSRVFFPSAARLVPSRSRPARMRARAVGVARIKSNAACIWLYPARRVSEE